MSELLVEGEKIFGAQSFCAHGPGRGCQIEDVQAEAFQSTGGGLNVGGVDGAGNGLGFLGLGLEGEARDACGALCHDNSPSPSTRRTSASSVTPVSTRCLATWGIV